MIDGGGCGRYGKGQRTFLNLSLLHLILQPLLQVALFGVGEAGDVELGLGEGGLRVHC